LSFKQVPRIDAGGVNVMDGTRSNNSKNATILALEDGANGVSGCGDGFRHTFGNWQFSFQFGWGNEG
jgi:hypothetical protein